MRACALLKRIQSCAVHVALGQTSAPRQDDGNQLLRPGGQGVACPGGLLLRRLCALLLHQRAEVVRRCERAEPLLGAPPFCAPEAASFRGHARAAVGTARGPAPRAPSRDWAHGAGREPQPFAGECSCTKLATAGRRAPAALLTALTFRTAVWALTPCPRYPRPQAPCPPP